MTDEHFETGSKILPRRGRGRAKASLTLIERMYASPGKTDMSR